jgi:CxxC-x17-CxxC domain-containing protein
MDKDITCGDCGLTFVFTEREQEFFASKGFQDPKRCPDCRRARKRQNGGGGGDDRQRFEITCAECGKKDTVPFEPRGDNVYCRDCFAARKRY